MNVHKKQYMTQKIRDEIKKAEQELHMLNVQEKKKQEKDYFLSKELDEKFSILYDSLAELKQMIEHLEYRYEMNIHSSCSN